MQKEKKTLLLTRAISALRIEVGAEASFTLTLMPSGLTMYFRFPARREGTRILGPL